MSEGLPTIKKSLKELEKENRVTFVDIKKDSNKIINN